MSLIKVPCMQITNMHCSGQTVSLAAGDYHATIVTVGAGLAELTFQGCHLVIPHKPEEMPLAHLGKVLIPWPNRIANGCYRYGPVNKALVATNKPMSPGRPTAKKMRAATITGLSSHSLRLSARRSITAMLITVAI